MAAIVLGPLFGPTLGLPRWAQDLSPFTHIPKVPAAPVLRRRNLTLPT